MPIGSSARRLLIGLLGILILGVQYWCTNDLYVYVVLGRRVRSQMVHRASSSVPKLKKQQQQQQQPHRLRQQSN
jgi:hypothetical protein